MMLLVPYGAIVIVCLVFSENCVYSENCVFSENSRMKKTNNSLDEKVEKQ